MTKSVYIHIVAHLFNIRFFSLLFRTISQHWHQDQRKPALIGGDDPNDHLLVTPLVAYGNYKWYYWMIVKTHSWCNWMILMTIYCTRDTVLLGDHEKPSDTKVNQQLPLSWDVVPLHVQEEFNCSISSSPRKNFKNFYCDSSSEILKCLLHTFCWQLPVCHQKSSLVIWELLAPVHIQMTTFPLFSYS